MTDLPRPPRPHFYLCPLCHQYHIRGGTLPCSTAPAWSHAGLDRVFGIVGWEEIPAPDILPPKREDRL